MRPVHSCCGSRLDINCFDLAFEGVSTGESGVMTKLPLDTQQLIKLGDTLTPAARSCLKMTSPHGHGQVGNRGVLRLPRAV
jgi:hypothetical protein